MDIVLIKGFGCSMFSCIAKLFSN